MRTLNDADVLRFLYERGVVTVPEVAEKFNVDVKTASYHLEKLVKLGLAEKRVKRYRSQFKLKPSLTSIPACFCFQLALTYSPFIVGLFLFLHSFYFESSLFLLFSSTLGSAAAMQRLIHYKRGKLEQLLQLLKKLNENSTRKPFKSTEL